MGTEREAVHIFLEIDHKNTKKLEFPTDDVTGREIKSEGGVSLDSDLARREEGRLVLVTNDQTIEIHNGEHFIDLPPGSIS